MKLLRRRTPTPSDTVEPTVSEPEVVNGKGRPTPKRRDAEGRRRGPVPPPPVTQREAYKRSKTTKGAKTTKSERRQAAAERRERMMSGDDRFVLARDRGPAKALARDVVDGRRNITGLFMPLALVVVLTFMIPSLQNVVAIGMLLIMIVMAVEGVYLGRLVSARVHERYPDDTTSGLRLGWYSFIRASQIRRLRAPRPRVKPGDPV
ncbi:DUF3043 domain-containing protein [Rhodococcus sp. X156]|uniref:DUF3043 domain-containing protein n=1 Tax=Rhodococcus sp. X156 TaxID=2499145 RepID=UPI000FDA2C60|nr:DUF3043 domain-containing protein [Rhodococcus sp. X156]